MARLTRHLILVLSLATLVVAATAGPVSAHRARIVVRPGESIQAATFNGPLTLGRQAPRSGQLAEGYDADLIVVDGDPLADITILADPAHIVGVWKAGRQVKGPPFDPAEH